MDTHMGAIHHKAFASQESTSTSTPGDDKATTSTKRGSTNGPMEAAATFKAPKRHSLLSAPLVQHEHTTMSADDAGSATFAPTSVKQNAQSTEQSSTPDIILTCEVCACRQHA
jgi:hypothetical protein